MSQITNRIICLTTSVFLMAILCTAVVGKIIDVGDATGANTATDVSDPVPEIDVKPETGDTSEVPTRSSAMLYATILTIVASMTALVLAAIAFWQVSRVTRNMSEARINAVEPGDNKELTEAAGKIASLERRADSFENRINEHVGRLEGYEARLNENAGELEKANQGINKNSTGLQEADGRIAAVTQDIESLQQFKTAVEATRSRILDAFSVAQTGTPTEVRTTTEQETAKPQDTPANAEEEQNEAKETKQPRKESSTDSGKYHYPG
jgi:exonuclease VII small subunit